MSEVPKLLDQRFEYLKMVFEEKQAIQGPNIVNTMPKNPGQMLPNGAIILKEVVICEYEFRRDSLVLAITNSPYTPFVSWHRMVTGDTQAETGNFKIRDHCAYGDYYHDKDIETIIKKFNLRVEKKLLLIKVS